MGLSRRQFFTRFGRSLLSRVSTTDAAVAASDGAHPVSPGRAALRTWLRPPGALPEPKFRSACTPCNDCVDACPHDAIRLLGDEFGNAAGTPAVIPTQTPCYLCEDMPCIAACSTGALATTTRAEVNMGAAVLYADRCHVTQGQPCDYCVSGCPLGSEAISLTGATTPVIDPKGCVGCGVCVHVCPADAMAIVP